MDVWLSASVLPFLPRSDVFAYVQYVSRGVDMYKSRIQREIFINVIDMNDMYEFPVVLGLF